MKSAPAANGLFTDLYELTMAAVYVEKHMTAPATFSVFIRPSSKTPRSHYIAAGLEDAVTRLLDFGFSAQEIAYLESTGLFQKNFLEYLQQFRFSGDVRALPEGTVCFGNEPLMEITAPLVEAQILETLMINELGFQTMIATKAARCIQAAEGRPLIDFALRRTQGRDAGLKASRAMYLAGFEGTSNLWAGRHYGIPVSGTMAHSFVTAFETELASFEAFAAGFPQNAVLLIDTYDTLEGARLAARIGVQMKDRGRKLLGVRLDSGDMIALSRKVREILDEAGLQDTQIIASSGFDEYSIAATVDSGAPINGFGVGTKVGVCADAPYIDIVYKLVRYDGRDVFKTSPGKKTLPGPKQVYRRFSPHGKMAGDLITSQDDTDLSETWSQSAPLLQPIVKNGHLIIEWPSLSDLRGRFQDRIAQLPPEYAKIKGALPYPVDISPKLRDTA